MYNETISHRFSILKFVKTIKSVNQTNWGSKKSKPYWRQECWLKCCSTCWPLYLSDFLFFFGVTFLQPGSLRGHAALHHGPGHEERQPRGSEAKSHGWSWGAADYERSHHALDPWADAEGPSGTQRVSPFLLLDTHHFSDVQSTIEMHAYIFFSSICPLVT